MSGKRFVENYEQDQILLGMEVNVNELNEYRIARPCCCA